MNNSQKFEISKMRKSGASYREISAALDIPVNTIKTYCRRAGLTGKRGIASTEVIYTECENCGKKVMQLPGRKKKRFCSDRCRNQWWKDHKELVNKKANYEIVCAACGKHFISYGNKDRKYCCHDCYVADRFGGACR